MSEEKVEVIGPEVMKGERWFVYSRGWFYIIIMLLIYSFAGKEGQCFFSRNLSQFARFPDLYACFQGRRYLWAWSSRLNIKLFYAQIPDKIIKNHLGRKSDSSDRNISALWFHLFKQSITNFPTVLHNRALLPFKQKFLWLYGGLPA